MILSLQGKKKIKQKKSKQNGMEITTRYTSYNTATDMTMLQYDRSSNVHYSQKLKITCLLMCHCSLLTLFFLVIN